MAANHFELFGLDPRYAISMEHLERAYREVQSQVHPDRFANASDADRRVAMQRAAEANDAYRTLRSPLRRAIYLLSLRGVDVGLESNTAMDPAFLMQQLEWREAVGDARSAKQLSALEGLQKELEAEKRARHERLAALLECADEEAADGETNRRAAEAVRQLMFIEKLGEEIADGIEALESV